MGERTGWGAGCVAGTDQRPEGIPPRESSPGEEEKDQLPQAQSPPQAPPRAKAQPILCPKGPAGLVGIAASPAPPEREPRLLPAPLPVPLLGGISLLPSTYLDPGKAGSSAQTCRTTTAHGLTLSPLAPSLPPANLP